MGIDLPEVRTLFWMKIQSPIVCFGAPRPASKAQFSGIQLQRRAAVKIAAPRERRAQCAAAARLTSAKIKPYN